MFSLTIKLKRYPKLTKVLSARILLSVYQFPCSIGALFYQRNIMGGERFFFGVKEGR